MKAKLIKKGAKPAKKKAERKNAPCSAGPAVDPKKVFASLFKS